MSATQIGWFWRFVGGTLDGLTIPTNQMEDAPPDAILAYPSPMLADAIFQGRTSGLIPIPDNERNRATLVGADDIQPSAVLVYRMTNASRITDEQYQTMRNVARGAEYEYVGTLDDAA